MGHLKDLKRIEGEDTFVGLLDTRRILQGWYEGMVCLLDNGADVTIADTKKRLALHASTYDPKIRCLALLLQHTQTSLLNAADTEV